ncbi:MAG: tetratricopeptide repeat protein [Myxococcaceae bacterium]
MPRLPPWLIALAALAACAACKDPETAAAQKRLAQSNQAMAEGRTLAAAGQYEAAITSYKQAASVAPTDPLPYLALADAYKQLGNDGAAVLAIKQAEELTPRNSDPGLKRQRADLFRRMGQVKPAIAVMMEMRDANQLTDQEVLLLSRMQARSGEVDSAYKSLERIQLRKPDDPDAKVVEAEILLLSGEEMLAAKLMDRLLTEHPDLTAARLLRARYFLNSGYADMAEADLSAIKGEGATQTEVVEFRARVLNNLKRYDEAVAALKPLIDANPRDAELIAQLAETKLNLGQLNEAQALVDQALALKPKFARALYVRARALETQGELKQAAENYQYALRSDPSFGPALSRIWRIYQHRGEKGEAMSALEHLFFMNDASAEEKVALAELYAESHTNLDRAKKLIDEALRREPENTRYRQIKTAIGKVPGSGPKTGGIIIMKGGR